MVQVSGAAFARHGSEMSLYGSSGSLATMVAQAGSPVHGSEVPEERLLGLSGISVIQSGFQAIQKQIRPILIFETSCLDFIFSHRLYIISMLY